MSKESEEKLIVTLEKLNKSIDNTDDRIVKEDFRNISNAFVDMFVGAEPRLIDKSVPEDDKLGLFLKALLRMGAEFSEAYALRAFFPQKMENMKRKFSKFKNLSDILTRYSQ